MIISASNHARPDRPINSYSSHLFGLTKVPDLGHSAAQVAPLLGEAYSHCLAVQTFGSRPNQQYKLVRPLRVTKYYK
jgi:hypothetical protein